MSALRALIGPHLGVADECEAGAGLDDLLHGQLELVREVAEDGEDDGAGQQRGEGVREADDQRILVVELSNFTSINIEQYSDIAPSSTFFLLEIARKICGCSLMSK